MASLVDQLKQAFAPLGAAVGGLADTWPLIFVMGAANLAESYVQDAMPFAQSPMEARLYVSAAQGLGDVLKFETYNGFKYPPASK